MYGILFMVVSSFRLGNSYTKQCWTGRQLGWIQYPGSEYWFLIVVWKLIGYVELCSSFWYCSRKRSSLFPISINWTPYLFESLKLAFLCILYMWIIKLYCLFSDLKKKLNRLFFPFPFWFLMHIYLVLYLSPHWVRL